MNNCSVLIFGASSFLGSRLAVHLHEHQCKVKPVEDLLDIPTEPLAWYRWQKLMNKKLNPEFIETQSIGKLVLDYDIDSILFVPSHVFDGSAIIGETIKLDRIKRTLRNFILLLEAVVSLNKDIKISLLTTSEKSASSVQNAWLRAFELSLSSYQGLYGLQTRFVRTSGVYGPWEGKGDNVYPAAAACVYIGQLEQTVSDIMVQQKNCIDIDVMDSKRCIRNSKKMDETLEWAKEYTQLNRSKKDVVFSSYLVNSLNPIYSYQTKPNSAWYMKAWFLSAVKLNLSVAVCHDHFSEVFKSRITQYHPNTDFVSVGKGLKGRSTNDYRFYAFYEYLLQHPEINRAFLTDMRDVKIFGDPFEKMNVLGSDYLYIGTSVPFYLFPHEHPWVNSIISKCHRSDANIDELKLHPHLNAGVLGGTRSTLLAFLTQLIRYFDKAPHGSNCNMGTIALVAHKHFNDYLYAGYPIQSAFKILTAGNSPQGLAIKHKDID